MSDPMPSAELEEHQEELDKAIDELRGALNGPSDTDASPLMGAAMGASMGSSVGAGFGAAQPNTSLIMGIMVDVSIVLGAAEIPVSELMSLQKGATIALNRRIGEPVDIVVNGRKIAKGEITVLESDPSRFGVRVTELAGPAG